MNGSHEDWRADIAMPLKVHLLSMQTVKSLYYWRLSHRLYSSTCPCDLLHFATPNAIPALIGQYFLHFYQNSLSIKQRLTVAVCIMYRELD